MALNTILHPWQKSVDSSTVWLYLAVRQYCWVVTISQDPLWNLLQSKLSAVWMFGYMRRLLCGRHPEARNCRRWRRLDGFCAVVGLTPSIRRRCPLCQLGIPHWFRDNSHFPSARALMLRSRHISRCPTVCISVCCVFLTGARYADLHWCSSIITGLELDFLHQYTLEFLVVRMFGNETCHIVSLVIFRDRQLTRPRHWESRDLYIQKYLAPLEY